MHINFNSFSLALNGGNRFVLELSNGLFEKGHRVTITHLGGPKNYAWFPNPQAEIINLDFPDRISRAFRKYYMRKRGYSYDQELYLQTHIPDCDANVATWCITAYPTVYSKKGRMFYLVQHYEPWFHPKDENFGVKSTLTYQLPITKLCVSRWLTERINGIFIGNGINLAKFRNLNLSRRYDVMIMPKDQEWKGDYSKAKEALEKANLKVLIARELTELQLLEAYNSSRSFLYLSKIKEGFGYPPLEAMACGTPVIVTPCTEYAHHMKNALVIPWQYSTHELVKSIMAILHDTELATTLANNGLATAKELNFRKVVDRFEEIVGKIVESKPMQKPT